MSCNWCPPEEQLFEQSYKSFYNHAYLKKNYSQEDQILEAFKYDRLNKQKISLKRKSQTNVESFSSRPQFIFQQPLTPTQTNFNLIRTNKSFNHIVYHEPIRLPQKKILYPLKIQHTFTPRVLYTSQHHQINKNFSRLVPNCKLIQKQIFHKVNLQNHNQNQIQKQINVKTIQNTISPRQSHKHKTLVYPSKIEPIEVNFNDETSPHQITQKMNSQSIKSLAQNKLVEQIKPEQQKQSCLSKKDFQNQQGMFQQRTKLKKNLSQKTPNDKADKNSSYSIKSLRNLQQIQCKDIQSIANASNSSDKKSEILFSWKEYMQQNKKTMSSSDVKFRQKIPNNRLQASAKSIIWQTSRKESYNDI